MENIKTALICHGGGMKAAFAAGAVYELAKNLGIEKFDIVMGMSASAPTATYFTTGQYKDILDIWQNELGTPAFVKKINVFKGQPVFNIDYLINDVFKVKYPLEQDKLSQVTAKFFIPVYNYQKNCLEFFNNHQAEINLNIWQAMRATMIIHNKHLFQEDELKSYIDPAIVYPIVYERAISEGATHFIIIYNSPDIDWNLRKWLAFQLFRLLQGRNFPKEVREKLKNRGELVKTEVRKFKEFCGNHQIIFVQPPFGAKVRTIMTTNQEVQEAVNWGRKTISQISQNQPLMETFYQRSKEIC